MLRLFIGKLLFVLLVFALGYSNVVSAQDAAATGEPESKNVQESNDDSETDGWKSLIGSWQPTKAEMYGKAMPKEMLEQITLEISNGKYETVVMGQKETGKLEIDLGEDPKAMNIVAETGVNKGKTTKCLYKLDNDQLTVVYAMDSGERPKEFESSEKNLTLLIVYQRVKEEAEEVDQ